MLPTPSFDLGNGSSGAQPEYIPSFFDVLGKDREMSTTAPPVCLGIIIWRKDAVMHCLSPRHFCCALDFSWTEIRHWMGAHVSAPLRFERSMLFILAPGGCVIVGHKFQKKARTSVPEGRASIRLLRLVFELSSSSPRIRLLIYKAKP